MFTWQYDGGVNTQLRKFSIYSASDPNEADASKPYVLLRDGAEDMNSLSIETISMTSDDIVGDIFLKSRIDHREFTLKILIQGKDATELSKNKRELMHALMPYNMYTEGKFTRLYHGSGGRKDRYINCTLGTGYPKLSMNNFSNAIVCELGFYASDPCWYEVQATPATADGSKLVVHNTGDFSVGAEIHIQDPEGVSCAYGSIIAVDSALKPLTGLVVYTDLRDIKVLDEDGRDRDINGKKYISYLDIQTTFIQFPPGDTTVQGANKILIRNKYGGM